MNQEISSVKGYYEFMILLYSSKFHENLKIIFENLLMYICTFFRTTNSKKISFSMKTNYASKKII
jgi:hypothetical protein